MTPLNKLKCRYLHGYKPCKFHKETKISCDACTQYDPVSTRILILKIGAAGEVIRITPLLHKLRQVYPAAEITWLTNYHQLVPRHFVDRVIKYSWESVNFLTEEKFDLLLSLDKENAVCALANKVRADCKKGFYYSSEGKILPFDSDAINKWLTGINDVEMINNPKHYVKEIFELCGYQWSGEKYILPAFTKEKLIETNKIVVGLNTGAGQLWRTRIPHQDKLNEIIELLLSKGYEVVLLGGPDEDRKNLALSKRFEIKYYGIRPYHEFINVVDNCDVIISPATMTLHIAVGLEKHVILLNNIFNKNEFYLYERGEIIEPALSCLGCYKNDFDEKCPVPDCTLLFETKGIVKYLESLK